ncbi:hypothetical protein VTI74DRAFT_4830 [Chaetomium olivicolor]
MNREIPGYYYDSVKRKYFRIEATSTAPSAAVWSSQNVKRRAVEENVAKAKEERARREVGRVKRARILKEGEVPLMGGLLAKEIGQVCGSGRALSTKETAGRAWAGGLKGKGEVNLCPELVRQGPMISTMWVGGAGSQDRLGLAYAVVEGRRLTVSYLPRDEEDRINFQNAAERYSRVSFLPLHPINFEPAISSIKFHEPSSRLLVACHYGQHECTIRQSTPGAMEQTTANNVLLAHDSSVHVPHTDCIYALQPAPSSSRLTCIAGTDKGIVKVQDNNVTWVATPALNRPRPKGKRRHNARETNAPPWQGDVLSLDFLSQNPAEVVLAGTRSGHVCILDLRAAPEQWSPKRNTFKHVSSVAHVKSIGPYSVLAAGPRNAMCLYDVRYQQQRQQHILQEGDGSGHPQRWMCNTTRPILDFPSYRNLAHIQIGWDVLTEPGYGSGIVAAAHDDDTVGLYSLQDGTRIMGGDVDKIRAGGVVKSLVWQTLPGDKHPSLFVGEGACLRKYSFWA